MKTVNKHKERFSVALITRGLHIKILMRFLICNIKAHVLHTYQSLKIKYTNDIKYWQG